MLLNNRGPMVLKTDSIANVSRARTTRGALAKSWVFLLQGSEEVSGRILKVLKSERLRRPIWGVQSSRHELDAYRSRHL
jgi:hypothetical protein